jgi:CDP-diglyceride synthetase
MKKLLNNPKIVICFCAFIISAIGLLIMMLLCFLPNWHPSGIITAIKEFVLGMPIIFIFLFIGTAYMNYEGSGTPRNIAINLGFHAFLFLTVISLILLIYTIDKSKKTKQEIKY